MNRFLPLFGCLWLALLLAGFGAWAEYEYRAGAMGTPTAPYRASALRAELILFVHPQCPCARNTLELLARAPPGNSCRIRVILVAPAGAADDWYAGRNAELAVKIPEVLIERDPGGTLAIAYGARTSGHAVVISPSGEIRYHGGLIPSRMANSERSKLPFDWEAIQLNRGEPTTHPVFGCPLFDED